MGPQRVADPGRRRAQDPLQKIPQGVGPIEIDALAGASHAQAGQEARQPKHVVTVHVGNKDAAELGHPQLAPQELVLGGFAAVEQPQLGALRQPEGHGRDIAAAGGNPGAGS